MIWTEAKTSKLKDLWATRYTASEIAERLGTTRSAVLGKIGRLGLHNRDPSKSRRGPRPRAPKKITIDLILDDPCS